MGRLLLVLVHVIFFGQYPLVYLSPSRTRSLSASDLWVLALSLCSLSFESAQMLLPSRPHICLISPPQIFPHVLTSPFIVSSIIAPPRLPFIPRSSFPRLLFPHVQACSSAIFGLRNEVLQASRPLMHGQRSLRWRPFWTSPTVRR